GVSAILSLTLTAMMCAHLLRPASAGHRPGGFSGRFFDGMLRFYDRTLGWVLRHQLPVLLVTIGTLGLTLLLAWVIPKGFFPLQATGLIQGISEAPPDVSFERMSNLQQALSDVVQADPDVAPVASFIGADGTNTTPNSGRLLIALKPRDARSADVSQIMARLQ